jgi:glycosyltransferase involved in cell wall biosynthesis
LYCAIFKKNYILINYFLTYTWFNKSFLKYGINICLLTHVDENDKLAVEKWKFAILNADLLIAISKFARDQAIQYGCSKNKIKVIPYGIDFYKYSPSCNLLVVGNAKQRKGSIFLQKIVNSKKLDKRVDIRANSIAWNIATLPKNLENLPFLYDWCDALLVPSSIEGGHTPTLEARAKGKPVITARTGWSYFELKNIEYENGNLASAINVINSFASNILESKLRLAKQVEEFTWDNWRKRNLKALLKILELRVQK